MLIIKKILTSSFFLIIGDDDLRLELDEFLKQIFN